MQGTAHPRTTALGTTGAALGAAFVGMSLIGSGATLGYLVFGTPVMRVFLSAGNGPAQTAVGVVAWAAALTAPAAFVILGLARLARLAERTVRLPARKGPVAAMSRNLPPDCRVVADVLLPDGRRIPELVVGPFGVAIIESLPPARAARHLDGRWEVRFGDGRWRPIENPLDRATRDAERVRRWLGHDDRDHVVKTYAAVVDREASVERTPTCAVLRPEQIPAYLAALPAQRSLNADRRTAILDQLGAGR